jgi:hypothetical protein
MRRKLSALGCHPLLFKKCRINAKKLNSDFEGIGMEHLGTPVSSLYFTSIWCTYFTAIWCILLPFGVFYCHLVYFAAIRCILLPFGVFYCHFVYFTAIWYILKSFGIFVEIRYMYIGMFPFLYVVPIQIWQLCSELSSSDRFFAYPWLQAQFEGTQWGRPGPGGTYWRESAVTGQNFFDKMVSIKKKKEKKPRGMTLFRYNVSSPNALSPNVLSPNALSPNALSPNALSPNNISPNNISLNDFSVNDP